MEHKQFRTPSQNDKESVDSGRSLKSQNKLLRCPTEPRSTKELLQSPLHVKISSNSTSKKKQLMRPLPVPSIKITQCSTSILGSLQVVPRHTKELLQSPLHKKVPPVTISTNPGTSVVQPNEAGSPYFGRKEKENLPKRKLDFGKEDLKIIEHRLVTYLEKITAFRAIAKRGLRNMNVNDFVSIVRHLFVFTGIRLKPMDKENYIEQTIHAMKRLKYPHKLNKSWLLMPSASVSYLIPLFDFLLDFSPTKNDDWISDLDFYRKEYDCLTVCNTSSCIEHKKESTDIEESVTLQQELQVLELQLLEQQQTINSIEQQQRHTLDVEVDLQTQLEKCQEELHAVRHHCLELDQQMGRLCIEIWRKSNEKKELKSRVSKQVSCTQSYAQILDACNNELRLRCGQLQDHAEWTSSHLQSQIGNFNALMRDLNSSYSVLGDLCQSSLKLPQAPTISQIKERQQTLEQVRQRLMHAQKLKQHTKNNPLN